MNEIGQKLRQLRRAKKITQQDVADRVGITRATISNYEVGRRTPHLRDLQKIAKTYGVGLEYFGVREKDETFELLARAKEVFESDAVSMDTKEELYREFMRLYLELKAVKSK